MLNARRRGKLWLLFGACAGLVLALAYESVSGLMYAGAQATPARAESRAPVTIDRAPQRVIKDQYPSFSAVAIDPTRIYFKSSNTTGGRTRLLARA